MAGGTILMVSKLSLLSSSLLAKGWTDSYCLFKVV